MKKMIVILLICIAIAGCAVHKEQNTKQERQKRLPDTPVASVLPPPEK